MDCAPEADEGMGAAVGARFTYQAHEVKSVIVVIVAVLVVAFVAWLAYQARLVARPEYDEYNARMDAAERWYAPPERVASAEPELGAGADDRPDAVVA
jgi:hypothetical protein